MTIQEWGKIAMVLRTVYRSSKFLADDTSVEIWYKFFKDYEYIDVANAVEVYTATEHFPPVVADIRERLVENTTELGEDTWADAWDSVIRAIRRYGTYRPKEGYAMLDAITQKAVDAVGGFKYLAESEDTMADRAHFKDAYNSIHSRDKKHAQYGEKLSHRIAERKGLTDLLTGKTFAIEGDRGDEQQKQGCEI